jgi:hypothetical protein
VSKLLKVSFVVHIVLAVAFGLPLLAMPGRFLGWFGWAPVDPLISRMFGAALLGLGWLDLRTLRSSSRQAAQPVIEAGIVFCGLAAAGMLWNMRSADWPWYAWTVLASYVVLAALWVWNWIKK